MKGVEFLRTELRVGLTAIKIAQTVTDDVKHIEIGDTPKTPMISRFPDDRLKMSA